MIEPKVNLSIVLKGRTLYPKTSKYDNNPRECKPARQIINLSKEAYNHMIDKSSVPEWIDRKIWVQMGKTKRLEAHLNRIMEYFNGVSYSYLIFEE